MEIGGLTFYRGWKWRLSRLKVIGFSLGVDETCSSDWRDKFNGSGEGIWCEKTSFHLFTSWVVLSDLSPVADEMKNYRIRHLMQVIYMKMRKNVHHKFPIVPSPPSVSFSVTFSKYGPMDMLYTWHNNRNSTHSNGWVLIEWTQKTIIFSLFSKMNSKAFIPLRGCVSFLTFSFHALVFPSLPQWVTW